MSLIRNRIKFKLGRRPDLQGKEIRNRASGRLRDHDTENNPKGGAWLKVPSTAGMEEGAQMRGGRCFARAELPGFPTFSWH